MLLIIITIYNLIIIRCEYFSKVYCSRLTLAVASCLKPVAFVSYMIRCTLFFFYRLFMLGASNIRSTGQQHLHSKLHSIYNPEDI